MFAADTIVVALLVVLPMPNSKPPSLPSAYDSRAQRLPQKEATDEEMFGRCVRAFPGIAAARAPARQGTDGQDRGRRA